jgi:hypothetical protein
MDVKRAVIGALGYGKRGMRLNEKLTKWAAAAVLSIGAAREG